MIETQSANNFRDELREDFGDVRDFSVDSSPCCVDSTQREHKSSEYKCVDKVIDETSV